MKIAQDGKTKANKTKQMKKKSNQKIRKCIGLLLMQLIFSFFSCNTNMITDKTIVGKNINDFKDYKKLLYDTVFFLSASKPLYEYQGDLFRFFPEIDKNDSIKIREMCFDRENKKLYVWFKMENGKWVSIDNVLLRKDNNY